jgi:hypothetical protein
MDQILTTSSCKGLDGKQWLLAVTKRTYVYARAGGLHLADAQVPLVRLPVFNVDAHGHPRWLMDETDILPPKPATDVVVTGSAFSTRPARTWQVAAAVGRSARVLNASGERRVETRERDPVFSEPTLTNEVALSWELAYGGYDEYAHRELTRPPGPLDFVDGSSGARKEGIFAYPRNRVGRGYFIEVNRRRADGALLPQLEDAGDLLTADRLFVRKPRAWIDAPLPGNLGWVQSSWYPRLFRYLGPILAHDSPHRPPREQSFEDGTDLVASPRDGQALPAAIQGAVPGLACERLRGDELVILKGLDPEAEELRFTLPGEAPHFKIRPPGIHHEFEPSAVLQSVRIDTSGRQVSLTWCGAVRLLTPMPPEQVEETRVALHY